MACYQEYDRWTIEDKYDMDKFAKKFQVFDSHSPIVDGRFNLNVDSIRKICAKIIDCDLIVFEEKGNFIIMEFGI